MSGQSAKETMDTFLHWLEKREMTVDDRLEPRFSTGRGWGIHCKKNYFRPSEIVMTIPETLFIRPGSVANAQPYKSAIERRSGFLTPFEALVLFFCFEDKSISEFGPYLRILPSQFSTPAMISPDLPIEIFPRTCWQLIMTQREEIKTTQDKMKVMAKELNRSAPTVQKFLWAWHIVNTRCIFLNNKLHPNLDNANGDTLAVIPFVDLLNHSTDAQVDPYYVSRTRSYVVQASRAISVDSEICICYGSHSNARLLHDYGFVIPNNPNNSIKFSIDTVIDLCKKSAISISSRHEEIMRDVDFGCSLYAVARSNPAWNVLAMWKIATMSHQELKHWQKVIYGTEFRDAALFEKFKVAMYILLNEVKEEAKVAEKFDCTDELRPSIAMLWQDDISIITKCLKCDSDFDRDDE